MRMKRVVSILAAAVLVFGLTGCNAITIDGETENASGEDVRKRQYWIFRFHLE